MGLLEDTVYRGSGVSLASGDLIMLFTDGLYEVEGANKEIYSQALLLEGARRRVQLAAPQLFDQLLDEVRSFSVEAGFMDDVCIVGLELSSLADPSDPHHLPPKGPAKNS